MKSNLFASTIKAQLLWLLSITFIFFGFFTAWIMVESSRSYEQEVSQAIHHDLAQHVVDNYLLYKDGKPDYEEAKKTFHDLMILGPNFEFYLVNKHGQIVTYNSPEDEVKLSHIELGPIKQFILEDTPNQLILGQDPKKPLAQKVFSVAPIIQMGQTYGYLYVVIGSQTRAAIEADIWNSKMLQSAIWLFLAVASITLIMLLIITSSITNPLTLLTQQMRSLSDEGFNKQFDKHQHLIEQLNSWQSNTDHDVHQLGSTIHQLLVLLQQQYQKVVSIDDLRKELLSHLSHDLRTPLASLLGYLETWELQQDQLDAITSREYIATAKRSAKKVADLIEQLFELAHLDGENVQVTFEPFPVAELIEDVLTKLRIKANEKNINMKVEPQDSSIIVNADLEKLERVFTNLIENAIRHTPENGNICIAIQPGSGMVNIEVSDDGIGIPDKDLPYIFDPHFKAGNSVRENTAHGGLGLAITKKLLELHHSVIKVQSDLEQGTRFHFELKLAA